VFKIFSLFKTPLLVFSAILVSAAPVHSEEPQWSGSVKSLNIYGEEAPAGLFPDYRLSSNRVRLDMNWQLDPAWQLETALDYQYLWRDPKSAVALPKKTYNRHLDMEKTWHHGAHASSLLQVDRLNLHWRSGDMDVTLGRQAVGFGRILIFSPLDVIAPFAPDALDTDIRRGVDALQGIYNYGMDGQVAATAVWGENNSDNSLLATWTDNRYGVDLLMITGSLRDRPMFGAGLAGSLGSLGLKGEFSVYKGKDRNKTGGDLHDSFAVAAVEAWYRFDNGISLVSQYLYNGPGVGKPKDYNKVLLSAPLQEGLTYLLGRHYLMLAPSYEIHPLANIQGIVIYNLGDDSALMRPTLDLNLADNVALQLFWTSHIGDKPRPVSALQPPEPRSEFGMIGDNYGLFLKYFF
jgi:hypothetical protein